MGANNAHGGINSPGWEQMRLDKAKEAQAQAEKGEGPDRKKMLKNRIIAAVLILIFLAFCVYFLFFASVPPVNVKPPIIKTGENI